MKSKGPNFWQDAEKPNSSPWSANSDFFVNHSWRSETPQIQCLSLQGELWICSEASLRMVEKIS